MLLSAALELDAHAKGTTPVLKKTMVHGLPVTIEHPKGTERKLHDDSGKVVFKKLMMHHYGFFDSTKGRDGDEVDCFIGPLGDKAQEVFIVHMKDLGPVPSEREDEDKCFVGFPSADAAKAAFHAHYPTSFYAGMTALPVEDFKQKLATATLPYRRKKITATKEALHLPGNFVQGGQQKCPRCGSTKYGLMPTDFETAKCSKCGKTWQVGPSKTSNAGAVVAQVASKAGHRRPTIPGVVKAPTGARS